MAEHQIVENISSKAEAEFLKLFSGGCSTFYPSNFYADSQISSLQKDTSERRKKTETVFEQN